MAHFFKAPSPQLMQTFRISLGESLECGIWGIDGNTGELKPVSRDERTAVALPPLFPSKGGIQRFMLVGRITGTTTIEGVNREGRSWACAEVIVAPPVAAMPVAGAMGMEILDSGTDYSLFPTYVDRVTAGHYDVGTNRFVVDHEDGSTIELPYRTILAQVRGAQAKGSGVIGLAGYQRDRATMKIHPLTYSERTTPNIAAMILETEEVAQNSERFFEISKAFLEIIKTMTQVRMASGGLRPGWKARVKAAPGASRPRLAEGIIQGDPPAVKLGTYGKPGVLAGSVQDMMGQVTYRVEAIILEGEGAAAEIATARLAHREMIVRAARVAQRMGQRTFAMRGVQANPNFQAHANRLAQEVGVAGSGRIAGRPMPGGHPDYEVILDAAKVLAGQ